MLPINNENDGAIFLLSGDLVAINSLVSMQHQNTWESSSRQICINASAAETYSTGERAVEDGSTGRLHLVDLKGGGGGGMMMSSKSEEASPDKDRGNGELWGRLLAEISYISSLKSVIYDHRSVNEAMTRDFVNRVVVRKRGSVKGSSAGSTVETSSSSSSSGGSAAPQPATLHWGDLEVLRLPVIENYMPQDDPNILSKFLCEWPVLVLSIQENAVTGKRSTFVMPLDPVEDVIFLVKAFREELDKFLESPNTENHFDFSVFTALHVMEILTTTTPSAGADPASVAEPGLTGSENCSAFAEPPRSETETRTWIPYHLRASGAARELSGSGSSPASAGLTARHQQLMDLYAQFGREILANKFCAYQILRFICISVKSGFNELIEHEINSIVPFYQVLTSLQRTLKDISICRQIGLRCSYCPIKYGALLIYGLSKQTQHCIAHTDLLRLTQYKRLECDVGDCYPGDSNRLLPIQRLSDFSTKVFEQTPLLIPDVATSELCTAFERLRRIGSATSTNESVWFRFNADTFFMSTIAHQTMKGEISRKSLSAIWALPDTVDANIQWIAVFAAGFAFAIELPSEVLDYLDHNGRLSCADVGDLYRACPQTDHFVIHLDYKDLPWQDYVERLKELFKIKNTWTKLELCAWLDRCLTRTSEPLDRIIQKYLKSAGGKCYENLALHLEKQSVTAAQLIK